jgi:putative ABC transport system ATP-binding protein
MSILAIENLSYSYDKGQTPVLKDINFEFEKGKIYAIVGRSGAGKTTLLSLISGLRKSTEGKILYNDKDISGIDREKYRSQNIGVIFQDFNLLPHLTALENVILSMDIAGMKVGDKKGYALQMLKKVDLNEEKANRRILKLSGGEQQRVAIARALSYNPEVIIADEPTGNLDEATENAIIKILKGLSYEDGKCVIIVTHSPNISKNVDKVFSLKEQ